MLTKNAKLIKLKMICSHKMTPVGLSGYCQANRSDCLTDSRWLQSLYPEYFSFCYRNVPSISNLSSVRAKKMWVTADESMKYLL